MTEIKKNERYIPVKNYIIAIVVILAVILLTWYGFAWYKVIKENKVATSYLVSEKIVSNEIDGLEEISAVFSEVPDSYFLYISYTGSEEIYNMEKELAEVIKDYKLADKFYYLNITSIKDNDNYINDINNSLELKGDTIKKVPSIIYFKNGEVASIATSEGNRIMNVGDFQKILDINGINKE